jgi:DNA-binding transcriptional LysR family regulator
LAGKWLTPSIQRVDVGRTALLSMISAEHGISLFAEEGAATGTANVTILPIHDEPETIPFSAVWSPRNRETALLTLLALASQASRPEPKPDSR